ncbi:MAG: sugar dehydrogenase, partial [Gammaproteobacteria bacterium]|nr:sugar dehydrogenase [Gammaproteobacteria bacterium]
GVAFVRRRDLLEDFAGDAVVALRGSWGTAPSGSGSGDPATRRHAKLVRVHFRDGQATGEISDVVTGFQLADGERWARPVGVVMGPDGALYFTSDEGSNGLFRLRRK